MGTSGFALLGAGGFHRGILFLPVAKGRYDLLSGQNFSANTAMGTSSFALLGAGGIHCRILFLLVAQGGNDLLSGQNLIANRAFHTGGQSLFDAGGFHGRQFFLRVASGWDGFLPCFAAKGAFQRNQSVLRAGGIGYHSFHIVMTSLDQVGKRLFRDGKLPSSLCIVQQLFQHRGRKLAVGNGQRGRTGTVLADL